MGQVRNLFSRGWSSCTCATKSIKQFARG